MIQKNYINNSEFLDFNEKVILDNYFVFYPAITLMGKEDIQIIDLYSLTDTDDSNVYCFWMSGNYFIHSFKWNDNIFETLSMKIEFKKFRKFTFTGQKDLILKLLERNNISFKILKDRYIYKCIQTNNLINMRGQLELARKSDINELSAMSFGYHLEEYADNPFRDYEYMSELIRNGIEDRNIYKLVFEGNICSMVQVISRQEYYPIIGHLFTKKEFRNKGFATSILYQLTKFLLIDSGQERCGLLSDAKNNSSNAVFRKVGYKPIYEQISVYKEEVG